MLRSLLASGPSPRTEPGLLRVALVGSESACARLRAQAGDRFTITGEYRDLASARAEVRDADALLVAPDTGAGSREPASVEALTEREIEVLTLLAEGLSNKGIAARLGISDQTVKFHVASISGKLGTHTRTETVRRAVRSGLITL
jgi:DNA-binding CsgD family transcriptional regulator